MKRIRSALKVALKDLSKSNFNEFCHELRDRRVKPRISKSDVEDKTVLEITDLLVSRFTEQALQVAADTLRSIDCNEEAERLHSKTKAAPKKRVASQRPPATVKKPDEGHALSRCKIEFGKHKGKSFKWLLENDVGYIAFVVVNHKKQGQDTMRQNPLMANKDALIEFASAHPEVMEEVEFNRAYEEAKQRSLQPGQEGQALVGFGMYKGETLQDLYESKEEGKISYVNFIRNKQPQGTRMDIAIKYISERDQEQTIATVATNGPNTNLAPKAAKRKLVQSNGTSGDGLKQKNAKKAKMTKAVEKKAKHTNPQQKTKNKPIINKKGKANKSTKIGKINKSTKTVKKSQTNNKKGKMNQPKKGKTNKSKQK